MAPRKDDAHESRIVTKLTEEIQLNPKAFNPWLQLKPWRASRNTQ